MTDDLAFRHPVIRLETAVPTFLVADVAATARWYADNLGYRAAGTEPSGEPYVYASLQRDGVELMLLRVDGYRKPDLTARRPEGAWDAYVRMQGVHAFYETVQDRECVRSPLRKQRYGDWEFEVRDPDGYILVFSESTV